MAKTVIIDYGMGNITSVQKALSFIGVDSIVTDEHSQIRESDSIILPGVGAFEAGMQNLHQKGLSKVLTEEVINHKKPFLGICLGMQLIAETGFEPVETKGLGWVKGKVKKLDIPLRVPHMGWNDIVVKASDQSRYFESLNNYDFYFIHSYHFTPEDPNVVSATVNYGKEVVACVEQDNIFATQFHPEKSQKMGLQLLRNFFKTISC